MARYIDVEKACDEVDKGDLLVGNNADFAKEIIYRTPTADVVEVVRRKNCENYSGKYCRLTDDTEDRREPDDYCSYGTPKERDVDNE